MRKEIHTALLAVLFTSSPGFVIGAGPIAIRGATLIDGTGSNPIDNAVVLVHEGRIACAGTAEDCTIPPETRELDATGRWLVPGFVDSHVHWQIWYGADQELTPEAAARAARIYLANGVTTVIDVGGQKWVTDCHRETLDGVAKQGLPAPRMLYSGWVNRKSVDEFNPADAGALTRNLLERGVDGIKVRNGLRGEEYSAITADADRAGRPVYGHTYYQESTGFVDLTVPAITAGVDGIMHVLGIPPIDVDNAPPPPEIPLEDWEAWWLAGAELWNHATDESMDALIRLLIDNGTWLQPTLVTDVELVRPGYSKDSPGWAWSPMTWSETRFGFPSYEGEELERYGAAFVQMQKFVHRFHEAGGMLLAGTDGLPMPGFGLQDDMALLAESGIPPMTVLQAASRNAALAWHKTEEFGTLEAGKAADIVILEGNPLIDISEARNIWRVVRAGVVYDPAALLEDG